MLVVVTVGLSVDAGEPSAPVDCLPDAVAAWDAALPDPGIRFGAANLPGIVLGVPGDSPASAGATSVASSGNGGSVTVAFHDIVIEDRPGPDFIVFENPYFIGAPPATDQDDFLVFAEPAFVEVSFDGESWVAFPHDATALAESVGVNPDRDLYLRLDGLAGVTPTLTGNWTVPDDRAAFDPSGSGGVSGAGGDAFDLADVDLAEIRYVRLTDADTRNGFAGAAEGFDLDAVVALHARPTLPVTADGDGDGLSDLAETRWYGSNPGNADTDGDGVDDGREVAGCRDPSSNSVEPFVVRQPGLWTAPGIDDPGCTELRWTFLGSGRTYELRRGELSALADAGDSTDLGATDCLATGHLTVRWACDPSIPAPGDGWFYIVREEPDGGFGLSSRLDPREATGTCP